jgi:ABC-type multidrug transport system ATPase subunit
MDIVVENLGKRYSDIPIITDFTHTFTSAQYNGVAGFNGSGKSTLMKMLAGYLTPSKGSIKYIKDNKEVGRDAIFSHIAFTAPYISIINDFTLKENFLFLKKFKPLVQPTTYDDILQILQWKDTRDKPINHFSSGMKQKANLLLAFLVDSSILLLDEPTSYLDVHAREWYHQMLSMYGSGRTVIIASNEVADFTEETRVVSL